MFALLRVLFTLLALLIIFSPVTSSAPVPPPAKEATLEQILEWLPEDTETIVVAPGPFALPKNDGGKNENLFSELFRCWELLPVWPFFDPSFFKELGNHKCTCAVEGSRRFTKPKQFGSMRYEGARILQVEPAAAVVVRNWFQARRKAADKEIEVLGYPVAVSIPRQMEKERLVIEGSDTFYAQPLPGIAIVATHRGYLEDVLRRMTARPKQCVLSQGSLERKQVNEKAPVWGVRKYRRDPTNSDPTSPLDGKEEDKCLDSAAVGFVFWLERGTANTIQARYLSRADDALGIVNENWFGPPLTPKDKQDIPGVVHITILLTKDNEALCANLILRRLGHGFLTPAGW